ncbi:MAG TPA: hypothetical protein VMD05_03070 [Candidatus Nanoarchaeia archaeon]|nr:hypothetical protein [Candidatus Nanoarchaeia archaeon]
MRPLWRANRERVHSRFVATNLWKAAVVLVRNSCLSSFIPFRLAEEEISNNGLLVFVRRCQGLFRKYFIKMKNSNRMPRSNDEGMHDPLRLELGLFVLPKRANPSLE